VAALCEGRAIFDNIQRTIVYLLTGNAGELALMLVAAAMGLPAPLLPLQLLWVNLVTDGAPALALVMEPADPGVLERPPRAPNSPILSRRAWATVASIGIVEGGVTLAAFVWQYRIAGVDAARAAAFCTLVFSEILRAMGARHAKLPIWRLQLLGNMPVVWVMLLSLVVQVLLASVPAVGQVFHSGLEPAVIAYCFVLALLPMTVVELLKLSTSDQH
jgi:Ca2+-transporting ATPase